MLKKLLHLFVVSGQDKHMSKLYFPFQPREVKDLAAWKLCSLSADSFATKIVPPPALTTSSMCFLIPATPSFLGEPSSLDEAFPGETGET